MPEISNDVLAERIEAYSKQTILESQQIRRDLSSFSDQFGRLADSVTQIVERVSMHERAPGHTESIFRLTNTEKQAEANRLQIEQIRHVVELVEKVADIDKRVTALKSHQDSEESFQAGRKSALSTGEKIVLLIIASGPFILAGIKALE